MNRITSIGVYNYKKKKLCDLYDSQAQVRGQAYNISWTRNDDGIDTLTFTIPYKVDGEKNFRWQYMKSEYLIRMVRGERIVWFIASKPVRSKSNKEIVGTVTCNGFPAILKTKNIYKTFDDENGIGTVDYLMAQVLDGTGWTLGHCDTLYETGTTTVMVRSLKSDGKKGALGLINTVCNLFKCYPVYDSDAMVVNIYALSNHGNTLELEVGRNADTLAVNDNSEDIVTRLFVEGEYGDDGYVGIDDVNPTGLNYILNFDYYREIGLFDEDHEAALQTYLADMLATRTQIMAEQQELNDCEGQINTLIGQCKLAAYYPSVSLSVPVYTYGDPTASQKKMQAGDKIAVLNTDGTYRYETITTTAAAIVGTGDYCLVKFATPSAGSIGAKEVQVEAKKQAIANLERKIAATVNPDKIAEYEAEIAGLEDEIEAIYTGTSSIDPDKKAEDAKSYIPADYDGNTDLTDRIIVPGQRMINAGYTEFDANKYATLYSSAYTETIDGTSHIIGVTCIKQDGTVLGRSALLSYISEIVSAANSQHKPLMDVDNLRLVLRDEIVKPEETEDYALDRVTRWLVALHELQAGWDNVRAMYNWYGESASVMDPGEYFEDIRGLYTSSLYDMMSSLFIAGGIMSEHNELNDSINDLLIEQDEIEDTFVDAMGNLLRDGYWQNNNYIPGQEAALYADALEISKQMAYPEVSYSLKYVRIPDDLDLALDDVEINDYGHVIDEDLDVNDKLFVRKITIGIDHESDGSVEVNNNDVTLSNNDLGSIMSRISQLSDLVEQKNEVYERAKAITSSGNIFTDRLNGKIDVLTTQLSSTISNWYTDEQGNILFIAADGNSAMMLCGAGFMIANSKNEDGTWNWRTFGTGSGFTADEIIAGFISAERIEAGSISTDKLMPNVGSTLVITGNPAITDLNDQIAPEFDEDTSYTAGQLVRHDGVIYVFTQDHPAGAWNPTHVAATNITTQIELMPDKIIQEVKQEGYSRTFISETDPALDPANAVVPGDYWIIPSKTDGIWETLKSKKWNDIKNVLWYDVMNHVSDMYCRKGTGDDAEWIPVTDKAAISEAFTRIEQTKDAIIQEAYRANQAEGELSAQIVLTAEAIEQSVERNYMAKTETYQTVSDIIEDAHDFATEKAETAQAASIAKTDRYQSAEAIVETAVAVVDGDLNSLPEFSTTVQYHKGDAVKYDGAGYIFTTDHIGTWDTNDVKEISPYIAQTGVYQTADSIYQVAKKYTDDNAYAIQSHIDIKAEGIEMDGNTYIHMDAGSEITLGVTGSGVQINKDGINIDTGGSLTVNAANLQISSNGTLSAKDVVLSGTIQRNGYDVLTHENIIVQSEEPSTSLPIGTVWIKPTGASTKVANHEYTYALHENRYSLRSHPYVGTLTGAATSASGSTFKYSATAMVMLTADVTNAQLTLSLNNNAVILTTTVTGYRFQTLQAVFNEVTSNVWLGDLAAQNNISSIPFILSSDTYDVNNASSETNQAMKIILVSTTPSSGGTVAWGNCEVKVLQ